MTQTQENATAQKWSNRRKWFLWIVGAVLVYIVLYAIGAELPGAENAPQQGSQAVSTSMSGQTASLGARTSFGEGTYRVGTDIESGLYRTAGGDGCYWARLEGFGGDEIIQNYIGNGPAVVTISPNDVGFETRRCGTWEKQ